MAQFAIVVKVQDINHSQMRLMPAHAVPILTRAGAKMLQSKLDFVDSVVRLQVEAPDGWDQGEQVAAELQEHLDLLTSSSPDH